MFCFPDEQQVWAAGTWARFLSGTSHNLAGKIEKFQLRPPHEMEMNLEIIRRVVYTRNPTTTGKLVYEACKNAQNKIHFIGWRMTGGGESGVGLSGFTSFKNDCPLPGEATVYVNLDLCLQVRAPNDPNPNKILNGYIILLHEMGHARQWLSWGTPRFNSTLIEDNEMRSQRVAEAKIKAENKYKTQAIPYMSKLKLVDQAVLELVGHADYYGNKFPNDIELLNWIDHEGPICDDWKIARRPTYWAVSEVLYPDYS